MQVWFDPLPARGACSQKNISNLQKPYVYKRLDFAYKFESIEYTSVYHKNISNLQKPYVYKRLDFAYKFESIEYKSVSELSAQLSSGYVVARAELSGCQNN